MRYLFIILMFISFGSMAQRKTIVNEVKTDSINGNVRDSIAIGDKMYYSGTPSITEDGDIIYKGAADALYWLSTESFSVSSDTITYSDSLKFLSNSGNETFLTMFPNKFILRSDESVNDFGSIIDVNGRQNFHIRHNVDLASGNYPFNIQHYGGVGELNIKCKGFGTDLVLMQEVQSGGGGDIILDNRYTTGNNDIIIKSGIGRGAIYDADYTSGFVSLSLVHKGYSDANLRGFSLPTIVGQAGNSIRVNSGETAWEYYAPDFIPLEGNPLLTDQLVIDVPDNNQFAINNSSGTGAYDFTTIGSNRTVMDFVMDSVGTNVHLSIGVDSTSFQDNRTVKRGIEYSEPEIYVTQPGSLADKQYVDNKVTGFSYIGIDTVNINSWNMDASVAGTATVTVDLSGVVSAANKILDVKVTILSDAGTIGYQFLDELDVAGSCQQCGYLDPFSSTTITINQKVGGFFDSTTFDDTGVNRGYVTVIYLK